MSVRIATSNVNSLKARLEKVTWWLDRARPDVLLMQETKLADGDVPELAFRTAGYTVAHHGEGRWNGVAMVSRVGVENVVTNFGEPLRPAQTEDAGDDEPLAEARMISAVCAGVRVVWVYAPNGGVVGSPFYKARKARSVAVLLGLRSDSAGGTLTSGARGDGPEPLGLDLIWQYAEISLGPLPRGVA